MKTKILPFLILVLSCSSIIAQVNITFELNTALMPSIDPAGIFIAGGTGFGSPGDNQLTDSNNDGIYTITIQKEVGFSSNYIFLNGNCPGWDCKENLGGLPCGDPANYNDRFLPAIMSDTTIYACFGTCDNDGTCTIVTDSIDITIMLNTATISSIDPAGLFIAGGGGFGSPGDNPLLDPDGDGIYTGIIKRPVGFTSHYAFLNGNCGDYSCKENIAGLPCADPTAYNDRFLPSVYSDTTILACFGTCDDDGSCTIVTDSIEITFKLNTANISVDPGGVFLAGGGNFGNPGDNPMIDPDGDGIYTITVTKAVGFQSHYAFTNGNCGDWSCKEDLAGLSCADPISYNDRYLSATYSDTTILACFGNCVSDGTCEESSVIGFAIDKSLFNIHPTLGNDYITITIASEDAINQKKEMIVVNSIGDVMKKTDIDYESKYKLNTSKYPSGIYFVTIKTDKSLLTKRFVVQK